MTSTRAVRFLVAFLLSISSFGAVAATKTLSIQSKKDEMAFDKTKLTVKPGEHVKLTFKNAASKTSGLQHNWVMVKPGKADSVATASISAGADKGWLADSPDIVAHTKLVNAGEQDSIEFDAPKEKGDYPYICTFPGHSSMMKGVLEVK